MTTAQVQSKRSGHLGIGCGEAPAPIVPPFDRQAKTALEVGAILLVGYAVLAIISTVFLGSLAAF